MTRQYAINWVLDQFTAMGATLTELDREEEKMIGDFNYLLRQCWILS